MNVISETADFFDLKSPEASTWNSTAALNAEPDIYPEMSVYTEIHRVVYKQEAKLLFTASMISNLPKRHFFCNVLISARQKTNLFLKMCVDYLHLFCNHK
jgi:hypothetical protein